MEDVLSLLTQHRIFAPLSQAARARLVALGERRAFEPGAVICAQGGPSTGLYLIVGGEVSLKRQNRQGNTLTVARLGAGETFGELELLDSGELVVSAEAETRSDLFVLDVEAFHELLGARDQLAAELLHAMSLLASERLRKLDRQLLEALHDPSAIGPQHPRHAVAVQDAPDRNFFHDLMGGLFTSREPG